MGHTTSKLRSGTPPENETQKSVQDFLASPPSLDIGHWCKSTTDAASDSNDETSHE